VDSIRQAVVLLGRDIIKNWVMLLTIANLDDTIPELVTTALVRGRFCQQLAKEARLPGPASFFTVGLFSALDAVMGVPMEELLTELPFTDEVKQALLEYSGPKGKALQCALELEWGEPTGLRFESVEWQRVADLHLEALKWADQSSASLG
jgi:EAL and modified HD-GYP domain-containing signal transduction protein